MKVAAPSLVQQRVSEQIVGSVADAARIIGDSHAHIVNYDASFPVWDRVWTQVGSEVLRRLVRGFL
jgi:hypothetical protein